jgi:lysozyme
MKIGKLGKDLIKEFEGLSLHPYLCPSGRPTIGYGNTYYENGQKVKLTDPIITIDRANELFENIVNKDFASFVDRYVNVELNQNQFDALVSFTYNLGPVNFRNSTLLKKINLKDFNGAANEFQRWNRANGKIIDGLTRRRIREKELFKMV